MLLWFDVGRQPESTDKGPLLWSLAIKRVTQSETIQTQDHFTSLTPRAISRHTFPRFVPTGYWFHSFIHQLLGKQAVTRTLLCSTQVWPVVTLLKTSISLILIGINAESFYSGQKDLKYKWFGLSKILCFYFNFLQKEKKKITLYISYKMVSLK